MRKLRVRTLAVPVFIFGVCATFQNCDAGFHYDPTTQELSSASSSSVDLTGVFGLKAYSAGSTSQLSDATPLAVNSVYTLRASGDTVSTALLTWSLGSMSTATCSLASVGNLTQRSLSCTTTGTAIVNLQAIWPDSTVSVVSMTKTVTGVAATPTPTTNSADVVTFRIASGTSGSPWNTSANPVQVFVGQTLTVYNDDSIVHRIHTSGSPFAHQADSIVVNGSSSFVILSAHSGTATDVYDHDSSTSSTFYINSIDGSAVYMKNCAGCHGSSVASSSKRGSSFNSIKNAIANNTGGMGSISLSDQEIKALVYVLNK